MAILSSVHYCEAHGTWHGHGADWALEVFAVMLERHGAASAIWRRSETLGEIVVAASWAVIR